MVNAKLAPANREALCPVARSHETAASPRDSAELLVASFEQQHAVPTKISKRRITVNDDNAEIDKALERIDFEQRQLRTLKREIMSEASDMLPRDLLDRMVKTTEAAQPAYKQLLDDASTAILNGKLSIEELHLVRSILGDERWCSAVPRGYAFDHIDLSYSAMAVVRTISDAYAGFASPEEALKGPLGSLASLRRLADHSNLATLTKDERCAVIEGVARELISCIATPAFLPSALADLARHTDVLAALTNRKVHSAAESLITIPHSQISRKPVEETLDIAIREFSVASMRDGGALIVGGVVASFQSPHQQSTNHRRYRPLDADNPKEREILTELVGGYVEELLHCQQVLQAEHLSPKTGADQIPDEHYLLSGLSKQFFKEYHRKALRPEVRDEVDVLGRMLELSKELGVEPHWLRRPLTEYHSGMRMGFVNWLLREGLLKQSALGEATLLPSAAA